MTLRTFLMLMPPALMLSCASAPAAAPADDAVQFSPPPGEPKGPAAVTLPRGAPPLGAASTTSAVASGSVPRAQVDAMLLKGPGWGLQQVQVEPVRAEGEALLGFRVLELTPQAASVLSPLQPDDIITHLNGIRLRRPEDLMDAWTLARDLQELRLDYTHQGQPQFLVWSVN